MGEVYELHADESWTHDSPAHLIGRYWCFFGGVFGHESDIDRLNSRLRACRIRHGQPSGKLNWKHVNAGNRDAFASFADTFFAELSASPLKYRQMFLDRSLIRVDATGVREPVSTLDVQYKIYYQFLKHAFRLQLLPPATPRSPHIVRVRLDRHSSQKHQDDLVEFATELPRLWSRPDIEVEVKFIKAQQSQAMQLCDLLCGAAGSQGNKMDQRRELGQRGMKPNQAARKTLAKHIYDAFRKFDAAQRDKRAFNWFESTGIDGTRDNHFHHKLRIWKFRPTNFLKDKGWENDHLSTRGEYQGPVIVPGAMRPSEPPDETF